MATSKDSPPLGGGAGVTREGPAPVRRARGRRGPSRRLPRSRAAGARPAPGSVQASEHSLSRTSQRARRTAWAARSDRLLQGQRHPLRVPRGASPRFALRLFRDRVRPVSRCATRRRAHSRAPRRRTSTAAVPSSQCSCANRASPSAKHSGPGPYAGSTPTARAAQGERGRLAGGERRRAAPRAPRRAPARRAGPGGAPGPASPAGLEVRRREPDRPPGRGQGHVEGRGQPLDLVRFEEGRLERGLGLGAGHVADLREHLQGTLAAARVEVAAHALAQGGGLADVQHGAARAQQAVDARAVRQLEAALAREREAARGAAGRPGQPVAERRRASRHPRARRAARPGAATRRRWRPRGRRCGAGAAPPPRSSRRARAACGGAARGGAGRRSACVQTSSRGNGPAPWRSCSARRNGSSKRAKWTTVGHGRGRDPLGRAPEAVPDEGGAIPRAPTPRCATR